MLSLQDVGQFIGLLPQGDKKGRFAKASDF